MINKKNSKMAECPTVIAVIRGCKFWEISHQVTDVADDRNFKILEMSKWVTANKAVRFLLAVLSAHSIKIVGKCGRFLLSVMTLPFQSYLKFGESLKISKIYRLLSVITADRSLMSIMAVPHSRVFEKMEASNG